MKNLVIVESPAKAKTIEKFLGPDFKVMSSMGHIRDLKKKGMSVDIEGDFTPVYEIPADKKDLVRKLKSAAKEADTVWLASDEDREGEAIAWHLYEVLGLKPDNTHRIVFHEITKPAILHAISNPRKIDIDRVNAQQARRVLDRIVGFELSPVLWKKIKPSLSAGRVQSVALRLVCEREKEVEAFCAETYYRLNGVFRTSGGAQLKGESPTRIKGEQAARDFLEKAAHSDFSIADIVKKPTVRKPAPPFTTSTLQQEAGRRLGFSVNTTMRVAQKLYEEGHITYMRTDSTNLSELALRDIAKTVTRDFGSEYLNMHHYHTQSKGAQEAHEAIRPTYVDKPSISGTPQEQRLYALIWKRAVASQMADARLERTNIDIALSKSDEIFRATGETMVFEGFMKVYGVTAESEDETLAADGQLLPPVKKGEKLSADTITATQRFTQPPARY
ncbi:MAG: type I DNA topoisomerase, partial [Muribaculaceae bacterium]|nr:type I DNA topoisomerase [Muribaculaceae bacterium]